MHAMPDCSSKLRRCPTWASDSWLINRFMDRRLCPEPVKKGAGVLTALERFHQRRTHDDAVGMPGYSLDLLPGPDTETGANGNPCSFLDGTQVSCEFLGEIGIPAGDPGAGDCVYETLASLA